jgi:hypothetical protein
MQSIGDGEESALNLAQAAGLLAYALVGSVVTIDAGGRAFAAFGFLRGDLIVVKDTSNHSGQRCENARVLSVEVPFHLFLHSVRVGCLGIDYSRGENGLQVKKCNSFCLQCFFYSCIVLKKPTGR